MQGLVSRALNAAWAPAVHRCRHPPRSRPAQAQPAGAGRAAAALLLLAPVRAAAPPSSAAGGASAGRAPLVVCRCRLLLLLPLPLLRQLLLHLEHLERAAPAAAAAAPLLLPLQTAPVMAEAWRWAAAAHRAGRAGRCHGMLL